MCATCTIAVNGVRQSETKFEKIGEGRMFVPKNTLKESFERERERGQRQRERKQIFVFYMLMN